MPSPTLIKNILAENNLRRNSTLWKIAFYFKRKSIRWALINRIIALNDPNAHS